jgi:Trypsin-co-occurring domain 1
MMAGSRLIAVRVGATVIEAEAVPVAGTEPTSGRVSKAAEGVAGAFERAQDVIIEVARSTAGMIERAGAAARPDRVDVEFGLKFTASGGVIMAGVAGEASLAVTLSYDVAGRRPAQAAAAPGEGATADERAAADGVAAAGEGAAAAGGAELAGGGSS